LSLPRQGLQFRKEKPQLTKTCSSTVTTSITGVTPNPLAVGPSLRGSTGKSKSKREMEQKVEGGVGVRLKPMGKGGAIANPSCDALICRREQGARIEDTTERKEFKSTIGEPEAFRS